MKIPFIGKKKAPKPDAICDFCTRGIYIKHEPHGVLHVKSGKPICSVCRVLRGDGSKKLIKDRNKLKKEKQEKSNKEANELAYQSQQSEEVKEVSIANTRSKQ